MPSKLDQFIDISITRATKAVTQAGFGTPFFLGESMKLNKRVKYYATIDEVAADFAESDAEYKLASSALSQEIVPTRIAIGKKCVAASTAITSAARVGDSSSTLITIEKTAHNQEIGALFSSLNFNEAGYNVTSKPIVSITDADNFVVDTGVAVDDATATGSGTYTIAETWSNATQLCSDYNSDWYEISITSAVKADIAAVAAKAEVLRKLFIARSSDADNLDPDDTDSTAKTLAGLNYDRTSLFYSGDVATYFLDAGVAGALLPNVPGSENWAWKTIVGVPTDDLRSEESSALFANNANSYETLGGVASTRYGTVASGEYIDTIRGVDWIHARLQEEIYSLLVNTKKVPYTTKGFGLMETAMRKVFDQAGRNGLLREKAADVGFDYEITFPNLADISTTDKANRLVPNVTFVAYLANAVNKIGITGQILL